MSRRAGLVGVAVAVAAVVAWWFLVYAPKGRDLDDRRTELAAEESRTTDLQAQLARLQEIEANGPEIDAELARLAALVPSTPDLADFIIAANQIAVSSGIDWISVAPNPPQASGSGPAVINMSMQLEGGFFQVLDYLNRLEDLERLVVVDSVNLTTGGGEDDPFALREVTLNVTLTARMFTEAAPAAPAPAPAPSDAATTTTTTPGGATPGSTVPPDSTTGTTATSAPSAATTPTPVAPVS